MNARSIIEGHYRRRASALWFGIRYGDFHREPNRLKRRKRRDARITPQRILKECLDFAVKPPPQHQIQRRALSHNFHRLYCHKKQACDRRHHGVGRRGVRRLDQFDLEPDHLAEAGDFKIAVLVNDILITYNPSTEQSLRISICGCLVHATDCRA